MIDLISFIEAIGYFGIFGIIFAESGILLGMFLPGDSLLFASGLLCSSGFFNIFLLIPIIFIAAVTGDSFGYYLGRKFGKKIFNKKESLFFNPEYITKTENFFIKHGLKTIFLARFIPVIRTFAPVMAGVGNMHYGSFLSYNVLGGAFWAIIIPLAGYYLGNTIPNIDYYILPIVGIIILLSIAPILIRLKK